MNATGSTAAESTRLAELGIRLGELGCPALVVLAQSAADPDLAPFVGRAHLGQSVLVVVPGAATPVHLAYTTPMERDEAAITGLPLLHPQDLDVSRFTSQFVEPAPFLAAVVSRTLAACGLEPGRVALAGHGPAGVIHEACSILGRSGWLWVPGNALVLAARKQKSAFELAQIRRASEATTAAFRSVARLLADTVARPAPDAGAHELWLAGERLTVGRVRAEVVRVLAEQGMEQPRGNIVAPAEEGAVPHTMGTPSRVLREGESLVVDLFPRGPMFADCSRTFCVGPPSPQLQRAHAATLAALRAARAQVVPGVRGWALQESVCRHLHDEGYATPISSPGTTSGYVHNLGHGVGFDLHEQPVFRQAAGAEGVLAAGDVFTLEPGLYDPAGRYGVRLEDLHFLGPDGPESLTPLPYDLDPRVW